jgi:hypothetical protein
MALIDELYDSNQTEYIKKLYTSDVASRDAIMKAIGSKIVESDKILVSNPVDILSLICCTAPFASSKEECQKVAIIVYKGLQYENPLPYIMDDHGFVLAEKTLTALSFFKNAMEHRCRYKGAPSVEFYRGASIIMFRRHNEDAIADHHIYWENFLSEIFI